ncbi:MAM and LDL-receptor class A domain-containing protein 1-like [Macrosteles quadrilineatus]|uniref:MAM and LDL-receptor class A domain-containing protein 1-like n=1 Tax=Macrosteles quadrilineatus TaxID=74068 RepID=UPI0023E1ACAC|nr:MAM and LDL-receptor class A domain-containing protein 1-like [Macrosteles quadrilineatus]XP_054280219.1 MAM and LDL-receptor class A domain-containing protein 1-like [Macrosteles quadrilineatus]XP_054280220.1 MAM and LDL-receptor class A domain-containing protein 1-like [Macrosteles quadrilineatus]
MSISWWMNVVLLVVLTTISSVAASPPLSVNLFQLLDNYTNNAERPKRQETSELCDFGTDADLNTCEWSNRNGTALRWELGAGTLSNWLGGPTRDASGTEDADKGGYIFFETSLLAAPVLRVDDITIREGQNAFIESPILSTTGAEGKCVGFSFAIDGLSASGLRIILQPVNKDGKPDGYLRVLWGTKDPTNHMWMKSEVLYTYNKDHQIVFEGVAKELPDPYRKYRGYVAVDSIMLKPGSECKGHCTFEGGFCGWTNDANDDFDWSLGRGSRNPSTGPATDRSSFIYGGMEGGYAFIDSSYPRRPGDVARLSSMEFEPTGADMPLCMRFWTHMYGNGVGTLSIHLQDTRDSTEQQIWSLSGEAGNAWYQAEVPVSSANTFKIVLVGKIGKNNLGDIAVDDISLTPGSCPTAPQVAAPGSGDCTFEVDECGWSNVGSRERVDDIDWERTSGQSLRTATIDHTLGTEKGYLMTLARSTVQRPGSRAWFTSRDLKTEGLTGPKCLSFWYLMNEPFIDNAGPSLGALSVYAKPMDGSKDMKPVWRLYNHQGPEWQYAQALIQEPNDMIIIEGIWGSSRANGFIAFDDITFFGGACSTIPGGAVVRPGECRFERDMCGWSNGTDKMASSWRLATVTRRPANLPDKTFGAPDGYIYYDLFNQILGSNMVQLVSPLITSGDDTQLCFSFWYAAFGAGDSAVLQVIRQDNSSGEALLDKVWSLEAKNMDTTRPTWMPAQVTLDASTDFRIVLGGQATNGGFAVDDIGFSSGSCPTRPESAEMKTNQELQSQQ